MKMNKMSHIQELDRKELKNVNGGNPIIIGIGVVAGAAAIIDYGMDAYKGIKKGAEKAGNKTW